MGIAERIFSERKRLGLSQADFANKAGVSLSSQKRYEKGEREPDASYLESIKAIGADGYYLAYGFRIDDYHSDHFVAAEWLLMEIADALALDANVFKEAIERLGRVAQNMVEADDSSEMNAISKALVQTILEKSPFFDRSWQETLIELDISDLANVVERFEEVQLQLQLHLSPKKKAQSISMLWRVVKSGGKVDLAMIEEAVNLAAS